MASPLQEVAVATEFANQIWTGSKYLVISLSDYGLLAAAGISQISFSGWNIEYLKTSQLSTRGNRIPIRYNPGTIVLRGAIERNTALYDRFWVQQNYLKGGAPLNPENILIYTYPIGGAQQAVPLSVVVALGCVPVSYKHGNADANGTSIPLEELVLQPNDIYRVASEITQQDISRDIVSAFA